MPGVASMVKDGCKFTQATLLKSMGKSNLGGVCLTLVMAWMSLCRRTGDPLKSMLALDQPLMLSKIVGHHEAYHKGAHGDVGDPLDQFMSPVTFQGLFKAACPDDKGKLVLMNEYRPAYRVSMRRTLFRRVLPTKAKIFCIVFKGSDGQLGLSGAHAVGVYWADAIGGVFDPNFGWIGFVGGMTAVDFSVVLSEIEADYGITEAFCYQLFPS